eukprot:gene39882-49293_t
MPALLMRTRRSTRSALLVLSQSAKVKDLVTCPAGSTPVNGLSKKVKASSCAAGSTPVNGKTKDALLCPPGSAPKNGVCAFCPVGAYALAGAASCTVCPKGFSAPPNSVSPDACFPVTAAKKSAKATCDAGSASINGRHLKKVKDLCAAGSVPVD